MAAVTVVQLLGAVLGGLIVAGVSMLIVRVLIVPRSRPSHVLAQVQQAVEFVYRLLTRRVHDYHRLDRILAGRAPVILLVDLASWLVAYLVGFALLLWPHTGDLSTAFVESGSSMFTLGYAAPHGIESDTVDVIAALCGLVVIALQIAYLPTLYSAFNRRETLVALLQSRAGLPPWGPELLARTRYGIAGDRDDLPAFYTAWEGWAADVAESHSNYPVLVQFRSPTPLASWLIGLLAVLDSAALLLSVAPSRDRIEPRLCLRMGFTALRQIADAVGIRYDADPSSESELQLTFAEFEAGYQRLIDVGFDVDLDAAEAWPHFRGWRANYESIAYALAEATDAVPALWSGPRRWKAEPIAPMRPPNRRPKS